MGILNLPCAKCGTPISIIKGTTTTCFNCGELNIFNDSYEIFSNYIQEIFGYPKAIESIEQDLQEKTLMERQNAIDKAFTKFLNENRSISKIIYTKIDDKAEILDKSKVITLSRSASLLALTIETYFLPHITNDFMKAQQYEIKHYAEIHALLLWGLALSIDAKEAYTIEKTKDKYIECEKLFTRIINYIEKITQESKNGKVDEEKQIALIGKDFAKLLYNITDTNPAYFIDNIEEIEAKLKNGTSRKITETKTQLLKIYEIAVNFSFINEDLRNLKLNSPEPKEEHILYNIQSVKDEIAVFKRKLKEIKQKFEDIKKKLIIIHCGNYLEYINTFIAEFNKKYREIQEIVDNTIINHIQKLIAEFSMEASEQFDLIEDMLETGLVSEENLVTKIEQQKNNLLESAATIKFFTEDLCKMAELEKLERSLINDVISATMEKKAIFDKKLYKFTRKIIDDFIEQRNEQKMTMEQQRHTFAIKLMPKIDALRKLAFNKKNIEISFPLFMELMVLSTKLEINHEQKVILLIENPNAYPLENVEASFFVPRNIMITNQLFRIDKLKPQERKELSILILPTQNGIYYLMAMVQYEDKVSKEQFWLPSVKIKITVGKPPTQEDILKELYEKYGLKDDRLKEFMEKFNPFLQEEPLKEYDSEVTIEKVPLYKQDQFFEDKFKFDEDNMEYSQKNYESEEEDIELEGETEDDMDDIEDGYEDEDDGGEESEEIEKDSKTPKKN